MTKLLKKVLAQIDVEHTNFIKGLNEKTDVKEIKMLCFYGNLFTKTKREKLTDIKEVKEYLIQRHAERTEKRKEEATKQYNTILNSDELFTVEISVEWVNSRTWGANPKATARYSYKAPDGTIRWDVVQSGSISGCGYDKGSTAVAAVLNQINPLLKKLYEFKGKKANIDRPNREVFGYGSGYWNLPKFEGGVGVNCYPEIVQKIGFEFKTVGSGKMFDVYTITKK